MERMINMPNSAVDHLNDLDRRSKSEILEVLTQRKNLRVESKHSESIDPTAQEPSNIWEILHRADVRFMQDGDFVKSVSDAPQKSLTHPNDIYFLDIDPTIAVDARDSVGTAVISNFNIDSEFFHKHWDYPLEENSRWTWKKILGQYKYEPYQPSNSIVIVDRYMFADNEDEGIRNICDIVDALAPDNANSTYDVLIIYSNQQIGSNQKDAPKLTEYQIASALYKGISDLRPYKFNVEVLSISKYVGHKIWADSHDRRIISNNFIIEASHGFQAIIHKMAKGEPDYRSQWKQTITFKSMYTGIENRFQDKECLPFKPAEKILKTISFFIRSRGNMSNTNSLVYINGNRASHSAISNKLLQDL